MRVKKNLILILVLILALLIRIIPLGFPVFTADEARIAFRGYTLSSKGTDELGRKFPVLFNSSTDYQLPATSYITALGTLIFGKSDVGVRIPFIILGVLLVFFTYKASQLFSKNWQFWLISGLFMAFSPTLIFISKVPNESIILSLIIVLSLLSLTGKRQNIVVILSLVLFSLFVSKLAWVIMPAFFLTTLIFYRKNYSKEKKIYLSTLILMMDLFVIILFLSVPQSARSIAENNLSLFDDIGIKNSINELRGQGIEGGWQPGLEKLLFNKSFYIMVGIFHWLSNLQPVVLFAQFDRIGEFGVTNMGAWAKFGILPFVLGVFFLIKKDASEHKLLFTYILIITMPILFIYPNSGQKIIALSLPFFAIIMTYGLMLLKKKVGAIFLALMILEVTFNLFSTNLEIKKTENVRPILIQQIARDAYMISKNDSVGISDDISNDSAPFIQWYSPIYFVESGGEVEFPYKFRQSKIFNIRLVGFDNSFDDVKDDNIGLILSDCKLGSPIRLIASKRDVVKLQKKFGIRFDTSTEKRYQNSFGVDQAYLLKQVICME